MGYTHYWTMKRVKGKTAERTEKQFRLAIKQCQSIVLAYSKVNGGLSGYSAHTKLGQYGGLNFNGSRDAGHETFTAQEHFSDNLEFNFCTTANKPYDVIVVACLIVLKHYLGPCIYVGSDGDCDDWAEGLRLATKITGLKLALPLGLRTGRTISRIGVS